MQPEVQNPYGNHNNSGLKKMIQDISKVFFFHSFIKLPYVFYKKQRPAWNKMG